jgi:hypothetical protein
MIGKGGPAAATLVASDSFAGEFRYANQNSNLINLGIQAFLGNDVTYDGQQGVITVAPRRAGYELIAIVIPGERISRFPRIRRKRARCSRQNLDES